MKKIEVKIITHKNPEITKIFDEFRKYANLVKHDLNIWKTKNQNTKIKTVLDIFKRVSIFEKFDINKLRLTGVFKKGFLEDKRKLILPDLFFRQILMETLDFKPKNLELIVPASRISYHIKKSNLDMNSYVQINSPFKFKKEIVFPKNAKDIERIRFNRKFAFIEINIGEFKERKRHYLYRKTDKASVIKLSITEYHLRVKTAQISTKKP